jgi:DNA-binding MarR family transcriptional regulator
MAFYESVPFEPDSSIGYQVKRVHQAMLAAIEPVLDAEGLTHAQWSVLVSLHFERGRTCAGLARDLAHDKGAMTRLVDVMEAKGWVTRERATDDRRHVILALTAEGDGLVRRARDRVAACWNAWLEGWSGDEVFRLLGDLRRLWTTIETQGGHA